MECKSYREFIIVGYFDGELEETCRRRLEAHLEQCDGCRRYAEDLRHAVILPLRDYTRRQAPERVWFRIEERLAGQRAGGAAWRWLESWAGVRVPLHGWKPIWGAAVATALLLLTLFQWMPVENSGVESYMEEQLLFLSELGNGNGNSTEYVDLGTSIEEFLL